MLIAFSEEPRALNASRGGRHVEFGIALALGKKVAVVGPRGKHLPYLAAGRSLLVLALGSKGAV